jgi:hypothetical protein
LKELNLPKINAMKSFLDDCTVTYNGMLIDFEITCIDENVVTFSNQYRLKTMRVTLAQDLFEQIAMEEALAECDNNYEVRFFLDTMVALR